MSGQDQVRDFPPSHELVVKVWRDPIIGPEFHQLIQKYCQLQEQRFYQPPSTPGLIANHASLGLFRMVHQDVLVHHLVQLFLDDDSARDLACTNRTFLELIREKYQLKNYVNWVVIRLKGILTRTSRQTSYQEVSNVDFMWTPSHTEKYVLDRKGPDAPELVVVNHDPFKTVPLEQIFELNAFIHKDPQLQSKRRIGQIKYLDLLSQGGYNGSQPDSCQINLNFVPDTVVGLKMDCNLRFEPFFNIANFHWPQNLHTLELRKYRTETFCERMLPTFPPTLTALTLGDYSHAGFGFGQVYNHHIYLPQTVIDLHLKVFARPFEPASYVHFPLKLQKLVYTSFESSLFDLPLSDELRELTFGPNFNSPIDGWKMPKHLKKLVFGRHFNQSLERVNWNQELIYFEVGDDFRQDVKQIQFPVSLKPENMIRVPWGSKPRHTLLPGARPAPVVEDPSATALDRLRDTLDYHNPRDKPIPFGAKKPPRKKSSYGDRDY